MYDKDRDTLVLLACTSIIESVFLIRSKQRIKTEIKSINTLECVFNKSSVLQSLFLSLSPG